MAILKTLTTADITGFSLNETINIDGRPEPCHFITFDSDLIHKVIPGDATGKPAARMFFLDPLGSRYSLGQVAPINLVTGQGRPPEIMQINRTGSAVNGLPAWSIAVARWENSFTPTIGYEVTFEGNTNANAKQATLITGCTNATITSAIVDYRQYTSALIYDIWRGLKDTVGGVPTLTGNALKFLRINAAATGYDYLTSDTLRQSILPTLATNALKLLRVNAGETDVEYVDSKSLDVHLPTRYHKAKMRWVDVNTVQIDSGGRARSSDDTTDIIATSNLQINLNVSGAGGLDLGSRAINTIYHAYWIYNPTTQTANLIASTVNEAAGGSITLPVGFTKKRQVVNGAFFNNASNQILRFIKGERVTNFEPQTVYAGGNIGFTTFGLNVYGVPSTARIAFFKARVIRASSATGTGSVSTRETGTTENNERVIGVTNVNYQNVQGINNFTERLNSIIQVDIEVAAVGSGSGTVWVDGYEDTEVL